VCLGLDVRQSPSDLITKSGDKVEIFCSHDKTDYRVMLWYQRSPGDTAMKLIGYLYFKDVTMEEPYKEHFNISGDLGGNTAKNASLKIKLGEQEHSASPSAAIRKAGDDVQLICTHGQADYTVMLWYQQAPGDKALKLIGHVEYSRISYEESYGEHFNITGDLSGNTAKNVSLFIVDLKELEHSALYYCAARYTPSCSQCLCHILQSPSAAIRKAGDDVKLFCTHGKSDYRVMLWYQQSPGDAALKLVGYGYAQFTNDSVEKPFREHFKLAGDLNAEAKNGSLSINNLKALEHTATYFCAAREAQYIKHPSALDKNLVTPPL
ncbi:hypothetical protein FQN60_008574, partial [Etheostoma spectabile]